MARFRKKQDSVKTSEKKDSPGPKKKPGKFPEVAEEKINGKEKTRHEIANEAFVEDLCSFYSNAIGEEMPGELLLALKLKTELTQKEMDEIEKVDGLVDVILEHVECIEKRQGKEYSEKQVLGMVKELDALSVEVFMKELRIICEKSPFESVRNALEKKLNISDYN